MFNFLSKNKKKSQPQAPDYFELCAKKSGKPYDEMKRIMQIEYNVNGIPFEAFYRLGLYEFEQKEILKKYKALKHRKEKRKLARQMAIENVVNKTGWSELKAIEEMEKAKRERGVSFTVFDRYNFFKLTPEEQVEELKNIEEKKAQQKKESREKNLALKEESIKTVMEGSGWTREQVLEDMKKAKEELGMATHHYAAYRFWELTDEERKTYFTLGQSRALKEKYEGGPLNQNKVAMKDIFNKIFKDYIGREWASNANCDFETFKEKFKNEDRLIYKPRSSYGGKGITTIDVNHDNMEETYNEVMSLPEGIVESFVKQHPDMAKLSKTSVNTIRVVTIMTEDESKGIETNKVHILYAGMRMGTGDGITDNLHSGGLIAAIDLETGRIVTDGMDYKNKIFKTHPDTGVTIKGYQLPYFQEMKEMLSKAGLLISGYYGWDVAITEDGPILIEGNIIPGPGILQIPYVPEKKGMKHVIEKYL